MRVEYQVHNGRTAITLTRGGVQQPTEMSEDDALLAAKLIKAKHPEIDIWILQRQVIDGAPMKWEAYRG